MTQPLLSVVVPVYNEAGTVAELLRRVLGSPYRPPESEVIVVDDGSGDGTAAVLNAQAATGGFKLVTHTANRGKGAAVRTGLAIACGRVVLIQDADLEYDPQEYPKLVEPILRGEAEAVYGSRYLRPGSLPWSRFRVAVVLINALVRVLYGQRLTDEATCYKAMRTDLARSLDLRSERFELCAEITAKLCRRGTRILEVPISYRPRSVAEGKKIGWRDAWATLATLVWWRFARVSGELADNAAVCGSSTFVGVGPS